MLWDQRLARALVRPLAGTPVHPNHLTTLGLACGLAAAALFATGEARAADWAALLFILAEFIDHADGELARLAGKTTRLGCYYDRTTAAINYVALFTGIGVGLRNGELGEWTVAMGIAAGIAVAVILVLRFEIERRRGKDTFRRPTFAGFEIEDVMYLVGPITWSGGLLPFLVAASLGAPLFALWILWPLRTAADSAGEPPR